ncbi:Crp/Fnr family transcriptional regulator [Desulfomarina sp.]
MLTFLKNISRLDSVLEVALLSLHGEILFLDSADNKILPPRKKTVWNRIIAEFDKPLSAEFRYDKGLYYICSTPVGHVIVTMCSTEQLEKIQNGCDNVRQKISDGRICRKILLKMLVEVETPVKPAIVRELVPFADAEVGQVLVSLLKEEKELWSKEGRTLLLFICRTLEYCMYAGAAQALGDVIERVGDSDREVAEAASQSLKQLGKGGESSSGSFSPEEDEGKRRSDDTEGPGRETVSNNWKTLPESGKIRTFLDQGKKDEAIAALLQQIKTAAGKKRFDLAEKFREWLMEIDSMAITAIIQAAEIIEEEKSSSISKEYIAIWQKLTDFLTREEFAALYHAMETKNYSEGEIIAEQGQDLAVLFFVNGGRVQLFARSQGREMILKTLGQGEIFGAESFFESSVWTMNARSRGAGLSLLTRSSLTALNENYPGLESRLLTYCNGFQAPETVFRTTKRSRRQYNRKIISGRITVAILTESGSVIGARVKGELLDISRGGVSFTLHVSKKEKASALLKKKVQVSFDISGKSFRRSGMVLAVRGHDLIGNEYSLHIEFDNVLTGVELQQVITAYGK